MHNGLTVVSAVGLVGFTVYLHRKQRDLCLRWLSTLSAVGVLATACPSHNVQDCGVAMQFLAMAAMMTRVASFEYRGCDAESDSSTKVALASIIGTLSISLSLLVRRMQNVIRDL